MFLATNTERRWHTRFSRPSLDKAGHCFGYNPGAEKSATPKRARGGTGKATNGPENDGLCDLGTAALRPLEGRRQERARGWWGGVVVSMGWCMALCSVASNNRL